MAIVLAIDPGSAKCGLAAVDNAGRVLSRAIVPVDSLAERVAALADEHVPVAILVGDGTGASPVRQALEALGLGVPVLAVDERYSSEAARARCVAETPARGWRKLLPRSLRYPDGPYDDYVAVILAERWWEREIRARS